MCSLPRLLNRGIPRTDDLFHLRRRGDGPRRSARLVIGRDVPLVRTVSKARLDGAGREPLDRVDGRGQLLERELCCEMARKGIGWGYCAHGCRRPRRPAKHLAHVDELEPFGHGWGVSLSPDLKPLQILIVPFLVGHRQPSEVNRCERQLRCVLDLRVMLNRHEVLSLHPRNAEVEAGDSSDRAVVSRDDFVGHVDDTTTKNRRANQLAQPRSDELVVAGLSAVRRRVPLDQPGHAVVELVEPRVRSSICWSTREPEGGVRDRVSIQAFTPSGRRFRPTEDAALPKGARLYPLRKGWSTLMRHLNTRYGTSPSFLVAQLVV